MKTPRTLIVSAQEDFVFPLAEAARKQIFAEAVCWRDHGAEAHILIVSPGEPYRTVVDGINIQLVRKTGLWKMTRYLAGFDAVHFWGTIGLVALMVALLSPRKRRVFTATDGGVFSTGKRASFRRMLAKFFHRFFDEFRVYTEYQKKIFLSMSQRYAGKLVTVRPHLEDLPDLTYKKTKHPSLLYMGHLSRFKAADIVLRVFENLSREIPELRLVIADNGLVYDDGSREEVDRLATQYPDRITLKGKVDPYEEIARAHLLIHPIRQHRGTFAFPLSLYECLLCRTPFLSTKLEGFLEFFDERFLCESDNIEDFTERARIILTDPDLSASRIDRNLKGIRETALERSLC